MKSLNKNIALIGLSGCGKTTIGEIVAERLFLPFYDVDDYVEKKENKLIKNIFLLGEDYFRKLETEAIEEISKKCPIVISTGGGVVKAQCNMETLQKNSIIFFINRPIENIIKDIDISNRPLLADDISKIYKLYEERYYLYKKYSNFEVLNDNKLEDVVNKIIKLI
ncbi:shikimate kinase [Candidatus Clostridium stratigraminis]|uniref:Shikimate kinase n=1 Tax=Candidatus Clostridium stratigraminis TaxID=3381661 RepID=A0ABW8T2S5_9CLOT